MSAAPQQVSELVHPGLVDRTVPWRARAPPSRAPCAARRPAPGGEGRLQAGPVPVDRAFPQRSVTIPARRPWRCSPPAAPQPTPPRRSARTPLGRYWVGSKCPPPRADAPRPCAGRRTSPGAAGRVCWPCRRSLLRIPLLQRPLRAANHPALPAGVRESRQGLEVQRVPLERLHSTHVDDDHLALGRVQLATQSRALLSSREAGARSTGQYATSHGVSGQVAFSSRCTAWLLASASWGRTRWAHRSNQWRGCPKPCMKNTSRTPARCVAGPSSACDHEP